MGLFKEIGKGIFDSLIGNPMKEFGQYMDDELTGGVISNIANKMSKTPKEENNKRRTHGPIKTLPCVMCPQCKYYKYDNGGVHKHKCIKSLTMGYESKFLLGQSPDTDGTAMNCNSFEPK